MRKSYWKICMPGPDGEELCTRLYADLRPHGEAPDEAEIGVLAGVEQLALHSDIDTISGQDPEGGRRRRRRRW